MSEEIQNNQNQNPEDNNANPTVERFVERGTDKLEVPENFWDKEKNAPDVYSILKSQMDLRTQIGEDLSPKDGVYQINIPEEYKDKLEVNKEDPLYTEFCKFAKSKRMSQKEFDSISAIYYKALADSVPDFDSEAYMADEAKLLKDKFGDDTQKVKQRIENFVINSGITDKDLLNELKFMQTSANGVALLDYLLSLRGEPMPQSADSGDIGELSLSALRKMQSEEGYINGTDKDLIDKVTKGYEKLYKTY